MSNSSGIDVKHVAELARVAIAPGEVARLQKDMEQIVAYIAELNELDVTGIEPTAHAATLVNVWRADVAGTPFPRKTMLANAPDVIAGELVKVPQVLPGEGIN